MDGNNADCSGQDAVHISPKTYILKVVIHISSTTACRYRKPQFSSICLKPSSINVSNSCVLLHLLNLFKWMQLFSLILSYSTDNSYITQSLFHIFQTFESIVEHGILPRNAGHLRRLMDVMRDSAQKTLVTTWATANWALHHIYRGHRHLGTKRQ